MTNPTTPDARIDRACDLALGMYDCGANRNWRGADNIRAGLRTYLASLLPKAGEAVAALEARLAEIMPLFVEARDALPAISLVAAKLHNVDLSLAARMDAVGTKNWRTHAAPPAASPVAQSETISVRFDILQEFAQKTGVDYNHLCRTVRDAIAEGSAKALAAPVAEPGLREAAGRRLKSILQEIDYAKHHGWPSESARRLERMAALSTEASRPVAEASKTAVEIDLALIRFWPDGMAERMEHVWRDLVGFIPNYKLCDLQRMLAEFGFTMKVYEPAASKDKT